MPWADAKIDRARERGSRHGVISPISCPRFIRVYKASSVCLMCFWKCLAILSSRFANSTNEFVIKHPRFSWGQLCLLSNLVKKSSISLYAIKVLCFLQPLFYIWTIQAIEFFTFFITKDTSFWRNCKCGTKIVLLLTNTLFYSIWIWIRNWGRMCELE